MPRDYYIVLGIERGADPSQIKHAYRRAIKRYHPDKSGGGKSPRKFIEAREAYEVLSDRDKRRAYDAELSRDHIPVHGSPPAEAVSRRPPAWRSYWAGPSILDTFFDGLVHGFYPRHPFERSAPQDLYMEIILSPEEARHGGLFPVAVPVVEVCPECRPGEGWWAEAFCPTCQGCGTVESRREFNLAVPPNTRHGIRAEVPMAGIGLDGVRLFVDVQVRDAL
jgi:molecular chaperone DnaJ